MTLRTIVAGAGTLTAGRAVAQALALGRHVIIGRVLSPGDLGVAAVLMVTSALLELLTQFSVDKLIVQARDGDAPGLQRVAQLFLSGRGVVMGLAAVALAGPVAAAFDVPEAAWAFAAFGAVPVIGGLRHLDCKRYHRAGRFGADMIAEVIPQAVVTAVAWPVVSTIGGYASVLWLLVLKSVMSTAATHMVARRGYGWSWDADAMRRILRFGWPLLAGSAVIFAVTQGDQLVVGAGYSMHDLGLFSVAATLALAMATMISSVSSTLLLPVLAARAPDEHAFARAHGAGVLAHAAVGLAVGSALVAAGPALITTLYGPAYTEGGVLLGWLGAMQAARLMRVSPSVACIARGDTLTPLIANIWRASALPMAAGVALAGLALPWIVAAGVLGELLALVALGLRARARHGLDPTPTFVAALLVLGVIAVVASGTAALGSVPGSIAAGVVLAGGAALVFVARDRWARPAARFRWMPAGPPADAGLAAGEVAG